MNPSAANEAETTSIRHHFKSLNFFVAKIADQVRLVIVARLVPKRMHQTVCREVAQTLVVALPGDYDRTRYIVSPAESFQDVAYGERKTSLYGPADIQVWVIPTDEERQIASSTSEQLRN